MFDSLGGKVRFPRTPRENKDLGDNQRAKNHFKFRNLEILSRDIARLIGYMPQTIAELEAGEPCSIPFR